MPSSSTKVARIGKSKYAYNRPVFRGAVKIREKWGINVKRFGHALTDTILKSTVFCDVMSCSLGAVFDVSKQPNASILTVEE
jgi:hypothetical protein